ncbi:MAG TPA: DUF58 domain-containing protein [Candidatus Poseidoniales archaeon]|nr:MAG: hypothetical protein CXX81_01580 [Euryarchaeota archaeon]HIA25346.1 DUF58 domain-containing protein [Candidatus Poseidoniales archaeon]HIB24342.1 DUF58 domain-containing protein [Candidatus Poseidoniales archaeon]HIN45316.1 DUF58 domain-containing protein [Candidatus Poseidoniales archaeon]
MAWSRKSAMFGSLAIALYLLGLTLRNHQLVTVAVVLLSFLTWAALRAAHADVSASGRRMEERSDEEAGASLSRLEAMRKLSSARVFEDGTVDVTLKVQNMSPLSKVLEVRDSLPEVMRIKEGANYILMELGPRRETIIEYTVECPLRGFYTVGPVCIRIQDSFGLFHKEKELHVYDDFLVFPKTEDLKDAFVKSKVPKIFTGAVNIRQPGPGSEFYNLREYIAGDPMKSINWPAYGRTGKLMVNERERDAVSDIILILDSRAVAETGPVSRNSLVYGTRAAASLASFFLSRRDSVGLVSYADEIISVDRDTGKKQLYVILTKLAGAMARGSTPLQVVTNRILPHINKGSPIIILSCLEDDSTIVNAVRDLRARDFDTTILTPSSLEFEFDARRLDRTGYEVLKTERDILISELRGLGAYVMDWEPDMLLSTALAGARGF